MSDNSICAIPSPILSDEAVLVLKGALDQVAALFVLWGAPLVFKLHVIHDELTIACGV